MINILEERLKYLHERGEITFTQLKEKILKSSKLIKLNKKKKTSVDPKTGKQILLSFSINEGKLKVARDIKESKKGGVSIKEACGDYGMYNEQANESLSIIEKKIHNLSLEKQKKLFGENIEKFYKVKLNLSPKERKNYDCKKVIYEKDGCVTNGPTVMENLEEQSSLFENLLNELHENIKLESFSNQSRAVKKLEECYNGEYGNKSVNSINSHLSTVNSLIKNSNFNLDDSSNINDYMLARVYILLNGMLDKPNSANVDPMTKSNIAKHLLGIKGISVTDIAKKLPDEQKEYVKENILNNDSKKQILSDAIKPVENILLNFVNDNLDTVKSFLILFDTPESNRFVKNIDYNKKLMSSGDNLQTYQNTLRGMKNLDRHLKSNNNFAFDYDGMTYEPSYDIMPINNMMEMLKLVNEADNMFKQEQSVLEEKDIYKIIETMAMSSGAVAGGLSTMRREHGRNKRVKKLYKTSSKKN
jgi:hypothetical protein